MFFKDQAKKKIWKMMSIALAVVATFGFVPEISSLNMEEAQAAYITKYGSLVDSITASELSTGRELLDIFPDYQIFSTEMDYSGKFGRCIASSPIKISSAGTLYIESVSAHIDIPALFSLYKDAACTRKVEDIFWNVNYSGKFVGTKAFSIEKAGTYYLGMVTDWDPEEDLPFENKVDFRPYFASHENMDLKSGRWCVVDRANTKYQYRKFKMEKDGYAEIKASDDVSITICDRKKDPVSKSKKMTDGNGHETTVKLDKGTYYIRTKGTEEGYSSIKFTYLKEKKSSAKKNIITVHPTSKYAYVKYVPSKTGILTVINITGKDNAKASITLCNSKHKAISAETKTNTSSSCDRAVYGVKKGKTYYIRVRSELDEVKLERSFRAVKEKSGTYRSNACTLARSKKASGILEVGTGTADWYKFYVSNKSKTVVYISGKMNGSLKAELYSAKGRRLCTAKMKDKKIQLKSTGSLAKGTYYIKISPSNKQATGSYSIMWK